MSRTSRLGEPVASSRLLALAPITIAFIGVLAEPAPTRAQEIPPARAPASAATGSGATLQDDAARAPNPRVSSLLEYMEEKGNNIVAALRTMPAEKYDFVGAEGQRSFRQQAAHVAEMNYAVCSALSGADVPGSELRHDSSKPELIRGVMHSFDYCRRVLSDVGDPALAGTFRTPDGKTIPKAKMAYFLAGNWADHYGHFATHLRLNGLETPSIWAFPAVILRATTRH